MESLLIGVLLGIFTTIIVYILLNKKNKQLEEREAALSSKLDEKDEEINLLKDTITQLKIEKAQKQSSLENLQEQMEKLREDAVEKLKQNEEMLHKSENLIQNQINLVKEQMLNATQNLLKTRQEELSLANKQQIGAILDPLQSEIKLMRETVDKNKTSTMESTSALKTQIELMMRQSMDIGTKADNLARALTAETKTQGNFGEVKLVELLESMELEKGIHFDIQETLRDESGNTILSDDGHRLIPDVILHFTDNRDAIIDSKMSITAFEEYMNADNEVTRQAALKAHIASVRKHVDELSRKNYSAYIKKGHQSLNYVIMYMFSETALQLALCNDTGLWKYAFDKNVFITGSQNLYAILRLTKESWTLVEQTKNQERIMQCADNIVHRVQLFSQRFKKVGDLINEISDAYRDVQTTTAESGQSIIIAARQLTNLGAKQDNGKKIKPLPPSELLSDVT